MAFSSSSCCAHGWTYDVFLSFRGQETRYNFTDHLHKALCQSGIKTFIDDELEKGEEISEGLREAIIGSCISIVVFSPDYASSRWCLSELMEILKCRNTKQQKVLPVFYRVDPSEVRHQTGIVGTAFAKLEERVQDGKKVQDWKDSLKAAADLSGHHLKGYESELIEGIVTEVIRLLRCKCKCMIVANNPVGIEPRVKQVLSRLEIEKKDKRMMVGIYGIDGIGKTTIAKAIYNYLGDQFEYGCFLADVRKVSRKEDGLIKLQKTLLSDILGNVSLKLVNVDQGVEEIKKGLHSRRVLLVLDDVNQLHQLQKLVGNLDWFGVGSRIIITTSNKKLLIDHKVVVYEMEKLKEDEALKLFSLNAFDGAIPKGFEELTKEAVHYADGLPLALIKLGFEFHEREKPFWRSTLDKYKIMLHREIEKELQISYNDDLEGDEKDIFLDIACFFKGEGFAYVRSILNNCDDCYFDRGIEKLKDMSLITIGESDTLEMHPLLQNMGRAIARRESPKALGESRRLWYHEDVYKVLKRNMGTNEVRGILVDLPPEKYKRELDLRALEKMGMLRFFINRNVRFSGALDLLSNELRLFDCPDYPGESIPSSFDGENLTVIKMPRSKLANFHMFGSYRYLTVMRFPHCELLRKIPNVSQASNLELLEACGCENLVEVDCSVGSLKKLVVLDLSGCSSLAVFPKSLLLESLVSFNLERCTKLRDLPEFDCEMKRLVNVRFGSTGIEELPSSFRNLIGLKALCLDFCKNLKFPKKVGNNGCSSVKFAHKSQCFDNCFLSKLFCGITPKLALTLETLDLTGIDMVSLPACIQYFQHLGQLKLNECENLEEISNLPSSLEKLYANGCKSLERFQFNADDSPMLCRIDLIDCYKLQWDVWDLLSSERHHKDAEFNISFKGNEIPDWFSHRIESNSKSCNIIGSGPAHLEGDIRGIAFCAVFGISEGKHAASSCTVDLFSDGTEIYSFDISFWNLRPNSMVLHYYVSESFELKGNDIRVHFRCESDVAVLVSCGVHWVRVRTNTYGHENIQLAKRSHNDDDREDLENSRDGPKRRCVSASETYSTWDHKPVSGLNAGDNPVEPVYGLRAQDIPKPMCPVPHKWISSPNIKKEKFTLSTDNPGK